MSSFRRHPDADERRSSAIRAAKAILALNLYPSHKRQLLRVAIWKLTEAEGDHKYRTRYRTADALTSTSVQHDHVVQQASLLDALCAHPHAAEDLLQCAVACTVTVPEHEQLTEHSRLNPQVDGWARYAALRLTVVDTLRGKKADLQELARTHDHPLLAQTRTVSRRPNTWRALFDDLGIEYELSRDRIANSPLRREGDSLQLYFHDRTRKAVSFSAHEKFYAEFSWNGWEFSPDQATKGYVDILPEPDLEREALVAILEYSDARRRRR